MCLETYSWISGCLCIILKLIYSYYHFENVSAYFMWDSLHVKSSDGLGARLFPIVVESLHLPSLSGVTVYIFHDAIPLSPESVPFSATHAFLTHNIHDVQSTHNILNFEPPSLYYLQLQSLVRCTCYCLRFTSRYSKITATYHLRWQFFEFNLPSSFPFLRSASYSN
jgi:hypothetical protein